MKITRELIQAGQSRAGGWSKEQLELIGVNWPPVKGWIGRVLGQEISETAATKFVVLRKDNA